MLPIYEAAWEMHQYLTRKRIPYVIIGGIAVQKWGRPRLTKEFSLLLESDEVIHRFEIVWKEYSKYSVS
ncbi:MAG: hypothetical protein ACREOI_32345 [bacterium]